MIHILHEFIDGPWGGGNQFLKGLRNYLKDKQLYTDDLRLADTILVNSKDNLDYAYNIKKQLNKKIIHRIDGVFGIYRNEPKLDEMVHMFANEEADGVIYQSKWSMDCHKERGLKTHSNEIIIYNAPNPKIFNMDYKKPKNEKIKLVTTSWSANWGKGFKTLNYLDCNLDFDKYDYEFIGNSPIGFTNIKYTQALPTKELAEKLKKCDIFITATENDTCSNSLLEALHLGLPVVGLDSGGTPEIIGKGGEVYSERVELIPLIDKVSDNIDNYRKNIQVDDMESIGNKYYEFINSI